MVVNTSKITGFVVLPNDTVREKSKIIFQMIGFDTDADDRATVVPIPIEAPIADDGSIDVDLWPNPEGVRSTLYGVTASLYNGIRPVLVDLGKISVPVSGGPFDLNDLLPVAPPAGARVEDYIAYLQSAVAQAEAAAASTVDVADDADRAEAARDAAEAAADASIQAGQWDQEVANAAARLALTGLATNWQVYQLDTEHVWRWDGAAWVDRGASPLALKANLAALVATGFERAALVDNFDTITTSGEYRTGGFAVGNPWPGVNAVVNHIEYTGGRAWQMAFQANAAAPKVAVRYRNGSSVWTSDWSEVLIGAVSSDQIALGAVTNHKHPIAERADDWNVINKTGWYRSPNVSGVVPGLPTPGTGVWNMILHHIESLGGRAVQTAYSMSDPVRSWSRNKTTSGLWNDWVESLTVAPGLVLAGRDPASPYLDAGAVSVVPLESRFHGQTSVEVYSNSAALLYGHYDQMMADHPDYVSRITLGQDDFGNDIHEYTFAAPKLRGAGHTTLNKAHPKIVVVNAVHPTERTSIMANLCFFDNLCNHWQQDDQLAQLRWGARIVLLAIANPSGVNAGTRFNANGVNVGRNLSWEWDNNDSPDRGPAPLSEPEAQHIAALPDRHPDACAFIDHHGHSGSHFTWIGARRDETFAIAKHTARRLENLIRRNFLPGAYTDNTLTAVTETTIGGPPSEWAMVYGRNAFLLEQAESRSWAGVSLRDQQRIAVLGLRELIFENWRRESETAGYVDPP